MNVAAVLEQAKDAFYALTGSCCKTGQSVSPAGYACAVPLAHSLTRRPPDRLFARRRPYATAADATLKLNGRSFKILQLLGEGGFSYVRARPLRPAVPTNAPAPLGSPAPLPGH